ncbi:hypothetical protein EYC84_006762 [Monilinia fructicola]|uniref:Uncharacterized protein n=1 Tax=Monilinia fructicola TaxID=38448 RepID=A0A5M9KCL3_MONFR|nr:hypothetical protein EYC84_006762 [Monilinia fructicola]
MSLSPEENSKYSIIIDRILKEGDLSTISAKQIRKDLQAELGFDLSHQKRWIPSFNSMLLMLILSFKDAVKALILERFDEISKHTQDTYDSPPATNGHVKDEYVKDEGSQSPSLKRETDGSDEDEKPKKKRQKQDDDAKLAALLQAQENSRSRSKSTPKKKKSSAKVKAADDSDMELGSDGEPKEAVKKGGFHKQYHLSTALADLVGEPTLSRPQVVKKIWEHIKGHNLQDPSDKRQIICDDKMQLVFKQDKVHMFTMNKLSRWDDNTADFLFTCGRFLAGITLQCWVRQWLQPTILRGPAMMGSEAREEEAGVAVEEELQGTLVVNLDIRKTVEGGGVAVEVGEVLLAKKQLMRNTNTMNSADLTAKFATQKKSPKTDETKNADEEPVEAETPSPFVIFTDNATKNYEDFSDEDISNTDPNIGIRYESNDIQEDTLLLLRYNCPDPNCDAACRGHPLCSFCGQRFYGDDELFLHCRDKHERCHVCDRLSNNGQPHYYVDYSSLSQHFRKDHFPCNEPECLEQKLIFFATEMDLKAHQLEVHGSTLSKDVRRDARTVDISTFEYRQPYVQERSRGGSQREQRDGRGRAFHRQMAVQGAQAGSSRAFGGQLTAPTPAQANARTNPREPSRAAAGRPAGNAGDLSDAVASMNLAAPELTPQEQARQLRHQDVIDRATRLLQNDQTKLNQFRNSISSYRSGGITAGALIDAFFALFSDTTPAALGTLIPWNDWRAINEDYPSLPAPTSSNGNTIPLGWASMNSTSSSGPRSNRVLKLKKSTAQSSRSTVSQNRSWGTASSSASTSTPAPGPSSSSQYTNPFPTLPSSRPNQTDSRITTTPWVAPTPVASSSAPASASSSRAPSRAQARNGKGADSSAFPALPPAAKPQSTIFGYGTGMVRRDVGGKPVTSAWEQGMARGDPGLLGEAESTDAGQGGKKKGNKGKKQVLMNWG